jgi:tetratricopeptide (TPR) repeat protein
VLSRDQEATVDERIKLANQHYERAVFGGDNSGLSAAEQALDAVAADLALARGRLKHARFLDTRVADPLELALFEQADEAYERTGDARGQGEAQLWIGLYHQVVQHEDGPALAAFERARALATRTGDTLTLSYVLRHLAIAEHTAGRLDSARAQLEESTRLRRELGFKPGVAANLVGLAYTAAAQDRRADALAHLDEARLIAEASGAQSVLRTVDQARFNLA